MCLPSFETLENRLCLSASVSAGTLTVEGTAAADVIRVTVRRGQFLVRDTRGAAFQSFDAGLVSRIVINAGDGNDRIRVDRTTIPTQIDAGAGNDFVIGGFGNDVITGGEGDDLLRGRSGDDQLLGGPGINSIDGGKGRDASDNDASASDVFFGVEDIPDAAGGSTPGSPNGTPASPTGVGSDVSGDGGAVATANPTGGFFGASVGGANGGIVGGSTVGGVVGFDAGATAATASNATPGAGSSLLAQPDSLASVTGVGAASSSLGSNSVSQDVLSNNASIVTPTSRLGDSILGSNTGSSISSSRNGSASSGSPAGSAFFSGGGSATSSFFG